MKLDELTSDHLKPLVQSPVATRTAEGEILVLTLLDVAALRAESQQGQRNPFSVLYRGPLTRFLPQGLYPLDHPSLGTLEIFIVPIRQELDGYYYEAVFN